MLFFLQIKSYSLCYVFYTCTHVCLEINCSSSVCSENSNNNISAGRHEKQVDYEYMFRRLLLVMFSPLSPNIIRCALYCIPMGRRWALLGMPPPQYYSLYVPDILYL